MKLLSAGSAVALALGTIATGLGIARAQSVPEPSQKAPAVVETPAAPVVSWQVFSGYKRYHANCSTCHGPDGLGGTFAPALATSLKTMDHDTFMETVVNGKANNQLAMPAFGANPNVMCYVEDIYVYLKARSESSIGRGRPATRPTKPVDVAQTETDCMAQ